MLVCGWDCGIVNLAFVVARFDTSLQTCQVLETARVDITKFTHVRVSESECKLDHAHEAWDWMAHFFQEYDSVLTRHGAFDHVFIEQQPIRGLQQISSLLLGKYRKAAQMISPRSMHKYMSIGHLDYQGRKQQTVKLATPFLTGFETYDREEHKDHQADALMITFYGIHRLRQDARKREQRERVSVEFQGTTDMDIDAYFNQFRYVPDGDEVPTKPGPCFATGLESRAAQDEQREP